MKIAAFTRYGDRAASTRQRLLQFVPAMSAAGIELENHPLLDDDYMLAIARGERPRRSAIMASYIDRIRHFRDWAREADLIWIYAELLPFLPPRFENWLMGRGKPVVYDFDDAFFLSYAMSRNPLVRGVLANKYHATLARSAAAFCGNEYLRAYAQRYAPQAIYLPTVVDTETYLPRPKPAGEPIVIGWIGSPTTWRYVRPLLPVIKNVCAHNRVEFRVVGAGAAAKDQAYLFPQMRNVEWSVTREVEDIRQMDIGIMPALDEPWALGKCGYKLIQYMACGLPVVASPIGAANQIVNDGGNGFLAGNDEQWEQALERLLVDPNLRSAMGRQGRVRVERDFSLQTHAPRLIRHLKAIAWV